MTAPAGLKYSKTHEWVAVAGDVATIGITDFAVQLLSDLVFVDLPKPGKQVTQGEPFGEIESVKHVSDLYAPISGEVLEAHASLPNTLDLLNKEPFGGGWMIKVRLSDPSELANLLDATAYAAHCATEAH
jgi:glycine cleavage system H protein